MWIARLLLQRGLGLAYLIAFLVTLEQFRPLLGERGLLPVPRFVASVRFRDAPSLFHFRYSDRLLVVVALAGILLSLTIVLGLPDAWPVPLTIAVWLVLWALYLSIVNVGQTFYAFGWESLLLEAGFLAAFLGPAWSAVPAPLLWLFRWLLFRVEFGAGLIKMRGIPAGVISPASTTTMRRSRCRTLSPGTFTACPGRCTGSKFSGVTSPSSSRRSCSSSRSRSPPSRVW